MKLRASAFAAPFAMLMAVAGCGGGDGGSSGSPPISGGGGSPSPSPTSTTPTTAVISTTVATLSNPWAMVFLPDGRMLVTERGGTLRVVTQAGAIGTPITGTPTVVSAGQGGLLDVALDRDYASNRRIYLSFAETGNGGSGLAVMAGTLGIDGNGTGALTNTSVIWRQAPKIANDIRHFGGRIAVASDGRLFVTAGERHQGAPAQDRSGTLGKIIRINPDGSVPSDNPFVGTAGVAPEIWSLGHRNPYGLVFASDGRLFESEMGPEGGDEFNLIARGANYGWRIVSEGNDGEVLPRHATRPEFAAPLFAWTPVIAPGGMIQYTGSSFVGWNGDFVLAGLVSGGLVQVRVGGTGATEVRRINLGARIREVEQGPDGSIWVLEDGAGGRLRKLTPAS